MTAFGQTDYWIGPSSTVPPGMVPTGLNLSNVGIIEKDSVRDISNDRALKYLGSQPIGPTLNFRSGQTRTDMPRVYWQDRWNQNVLHVYPGADNENPYQPYPSPPYVTFAPGGSLLNRTYYIRLTFVDSNGGESAGSSVSVEQQIPADNLLTVTTPVLMNNKTSVGIIYSSYNVYIATAEGSETLQNVTPIAIGTNWTEPTSGITTTGQPVPTASTIAQMGGYIIQFRYYMSRPVLKQPTDTLLIPDDYFDVIIHGVNALAWKFLGKEEQAQASSQLYKDGLTSMIWDKNLFPDTDFIRPDAGTYVNQQTLGYLPPFF